MAKVKKTDKWTFSLTLLVAITSATLFGGFYGNRLFGAPMQNGELQKRLKEYTDLLTAVTANAPEPTESDKFVFASIDGMLRTLDPHTSFLEPKEYADMQDRQKGTFYGLGILVTKRNDQVTVITPLEGTPAARLGVRAGDVISEVEGESTEDLPLDDVVKKLKGPKGTTVHIKIKRVGMQEPIPLTIIRAAIPTNSISNVLMIRPGVGYVRMKDFTGTTVRELDDAIDKLQAEGMQKMILDLRMNPGGLLDAAVGVSDHFLDKGQMIVYTKGRTADSAQEYTAPGKHDKFDLPVVVLVNRGSASASEIVAGAIQDHDRGIVVGETSWGKGLVQSVYTLQYGAGLALTTSKYYTPSGRNIQRDYSSFYDYYVADESENGTEVPLAQRKQFKTDTGRVVYGGGGITPDYMVKQPQLARTTQLLEVRSAIFNYAVDYAAKHPDLTKDVAVTPVMMEEFIHHAAEADVAPEPDIRDAMKNPVDRNFIERALKAEIVAAKYGFDASYPYRLQGDAQVEKALELFPEAQKLAIMAAGARGSSTPPADAGTRAAAATPRTKSE
ncbi:MAG: carboxyl-terminal processing protease [Acidobacteriota bacterium]|jgi:carboxyl-terminal processing protease|nr:carboxyl-terminal processing protease [Acidobacteriota bacterium]